MKLFLCVEQSLCYFIREQIYGGFCVVGDVVVDGEGASRSRLSGDESSKPQETIERRADHQEGT